MGLNEKKQIAWGCFILLAVCYFFLTYWMGGEKKYGEIRMLLRKIQDYQDRIAEMEADYQLFIYGEEDEHISDQPLYWTMMLEGLDGSYQEAIESLQAMTQTPCKIWLEGSWLRPGEEPGHVELEMLISFVSAKEPSGGGITARDGDTRRNPFLYFENTEDLKNF